MRFGSELLRKAEQIFTIIHWTTLQLVCFPSPERCLGWLEVMEISLGEQPVDVGSTSIRRKRKKRGKVAVCFGPPNTLWRNAGFKVSTKGYNDIYKKPGGGYISSVAKVGRGLHDSQINLNSVFMTKRIQTVDLIVLLFEKPICSLICTFNILWRSAHTLQGLRCLGDKGRHQLHSS